MGRTGDCSSTTAQSDRLNRESRIPTALQHVFIASQKGENVHHPPPGRLASTTFFRNFGLLFPPHTLRQSLQRFERRGKSSGERSPHMKHDKKKSRSKAEPIPTLSPQAYLDAMIRSRGYSTKHFNTLHTAYSNQPTELQQASYDAYLVDLVRKGDATSFRAVMGSGISLNPCNAHGESLVHMICRRGDAVFLRILVELGCSIQVSDDYGRTPLHDACWTVKPCFEVVDIILQQDRRLFHMADCRGALPLSYVRHENWAAWLQFLQAKKDVFWPRRDTSGEEPDPPLTLCGPNSRPIPNPVRHLTPHIAAIVASGKLSPFEAEFFFDAGCEFDDDNHDEDDDDFDDYSSSNSDDEDDSYQTTSSSADEEELELVAQLLQRYTLRRKSGQALTDRVCLSTEANRNILPEQAF